MTQFCLTVAHETQPVHPLHSGKIGGRNIGQLTFEIVARWFYKCEPVFPDFGAGKRFHRRQIYQDLVKVVKENPGLTSGQIALKLGRPPSHVLPFLWKLKKYCGALDVERSGFIRTPGLAEFLEIQCVKRMLIKLGSKKSRASLGRKLFSIKNGFRRLKSLPNGSNLAFSAVSLP